MILTFVWLSKALYYIKGKKKGAMPCQGLLGIFYVGLLKKRSTKEEQENKQIKM